jgi:hypothetical protein
VTISDDAVYSKSFSTAAIGWGVISGQFGSSPKAVFVFRAISSAVVQILSSVGAVNAYNQVILTGNTGADGAINISANNTTIYIENRSGAAVPYLISLFGSSP